MDALGRLALDDLVFGETGMKKHDLGPESLFFESTLDPAHKVAIDFLLQNNLNVGDIGAISSR